MTIQTGTYKFICNQGATFNENLAVTDKETGDPIDFTGCTAALQVRRYPDSTIVLSLETGDGIDPLDDTGIISILATAIQTAAIPAGNYKYDLEIYNGATVDRWLQGDFIVKAEITK